MKGSAPAVIAAAFQELKSRAEPRWQELEDTTRSVILVGTATCGRAAGAREVLQALRNEVKKRNLDCPVIEVGCLGHCYAEPLVIIRKPGYPAICYGRVNTVNWSGILFWEMILVTSSFSVPWRKMTSFPVSRIFLEPGTRKS